LVVNLSMGAREMKWIIGNPLMLLLLGALLLAYMAFVKDRLDRGREQAAAIKRAEASLRNNFALPPVESAER
jgi:hypothetical protein